MIEAACPGAEVVGLDADPDVLAIAAAKAREAGSAVRFVHGYADDPPDAAPIGPGGFDKVVSSLFFHHLTRERKRAALAHARRLLRPGGELHVADWGRAQNRPMRLMFYFTQLLDGFAATSDNVAGLLPTLVREAGFAAVEEAHREMTIAGTLSFYQAEKT